MIVTDVFESFRMRNTNVSIVETQSSRHRIFGWLVCLHFKACLTWHSLPSRLRMTTACFGRWSMLHSSWPNFSAAALTRRGDLRPIQMNTSDQQSSIYTPLVSRRLWSCNRRTISMNTFRKSQLKKSNLSNFTYQSEFWKHIKFEFVLMFNWKLIVYLRKFKISQSQANL